MEWACDRRVGSWRRVGICLQVSRISYKVDHERDDPERDAPERDDPEREMILKER